MELKLTQLQNQTHDNNAVAEEAIKLLIVALEKLKSFFIRYHFCNKNEEMHFFRVIKPHFSSKLIYYNEIYNIETNRPFGLTKVLRKYYQNEMRKLKKFYDENADFYKYYHSGNHTLDKKYFLRGKPDLKLTIDSFYLQSDHRFSTSHDYKVAKILANESIKEHLETQIARLQVKGVTLTTKDRGKTLKWTGSKVALVELIYALQAEGVFNNGQSDLKEIITFFELHYDIQLGQYHRTFLEIRERKSERARFLNSLTDRLLTRMDTADQN